MLLCCENLSYLITLYQLQTFVYNVGGRGEVALW
jgi:hypothetical protein